MKQLIALALVAFMVPAIAAPVPVLRTVPVILIDGDISGFTWVSTFDPRPIRICVSSYPIPEAIPCYVVTGRRYPNGEEETVIESVAVVKPPLEI